MSWVPCVELVGMLRILGILAHGRRDLFHRGRGLLQARGLFLGALRQIGGAGRRFRPPRSTLRELDIAIFLIVSCSWPMAALKSSLDLRYSLGPILVDAIGQIALRKPLETLAEPIDHFRNLACRSLLRRFAAGALVFRCLRCSSATASSRTLLASGIAEHEHRARHVAEFVAAFDAADVAVELAAGERAHDPAERQDRPRNAARDEPGQEHPDRDRDGRDRCAGDDRGMDIGLAVFLRRGERSFLALFQVATGGNHVGRQLVLGLEQPRTLRQQFHGGIEGCGIGRDQRSHLLQLFAPLDARGGADLLQGFRHRHELRARGLLQLRIAGLVVQTGRSPGPTGIARLRCRPGLQARGRCR